MNVKRFAKLLRLLRLISGVWVRTARARVRLRKVKPVKHVKKYIITLTDVPVSMEAARRCIESAKLCGEEDNLEIFPGVGKHESREFFFRHGLMKEYWQLRPNDPLAESGCFSSHYKLWLRCIELGEPIIVLEHDALFLAPIPPLKFRHLISLCANDSFMFANVRTVFRLLGDRGVISSPFGMAPGTCCYAIEPEGARRLAEAARRKLITSTDNFIHPEIVDLFCYYPFPVVSDRRFSLIASTS